MIVEITLDSNDSERLHDQARKKFERAPLCMNLKLAGFFSFENRMHITFSEFGKETKFTLSAKGHNTLEFE